MASVSESKDARAFHEIERLQSDKATISQTAADYLHEIERLRAALAAERERADMAEKECLRLKELLAPRGEPPKSAAMRVVSAIRKGSDG